MRFRDAARVGSGGREEAARLIPRFAPSFAVPEIAAAASRARPSDVRTFEKRFAARFGTSDAIAFSYGRAAVATFLESLGIRGAEVVQPAYTCSVVAHATVVSGNVPRFVDARLPDFNMDLADLEAAITPRTRAVIVTHLFGYSMDVDAARAIVKRAERAHGHRIWILQDCAHSFGARWRGRLVTSEPDAAVFGLNISKTMTSIFGGMLASSDPEVLEAVRRRRDARVSIPSIAKSAWRRAYLLGAAAAFSRAGYAATYFLQTRTPTLDRLTRAYHLDDGIRFPPDADDALAPIEARIGLSQLARYEGFVRARELQARAYAGALGDLEDFVLPPIVDGATYSHYPVRVSDPEWWSRELQARGVELGRVIDYSVPHTRAYVGSDSRSVFPVSLACSRTVINLPLSPALSGSDVARVIDRVREAAARRRRAA